MGLTVNNSEMDAILSELMTRPSPGKPRHVYMRDDTFRVLSILSAIENRPMCHIFHRALALYASGYTTEQLAYDAPPRYRSRKKGEKRSKLGEHVYRVENGRLVLERVDGKRVTIPSSNNDAESGQTPG